MAIGAPRWGGLRPDPYNPDSPDADNDGIVQEGTLFERPAGTRIVSAITGLELELGTPGNSIQDTRNTIIVDREGRPVPYRQSWSGVALSAREQNGTIGGNAGGTIGSLMGNLDGPPPKPKRPNLVLRSTDVDKNGKPLRVFVADDRRFHGVEPFDFGGFEFPGWKAAEDHWGESGLILPKSETPISSSDPRLPERLFVPSANPSAHRDVGVARADADTKKVTAFTSREDAEAEQRQKFLSANPRFAEWLSSGPHYYNDAVEEDNIVDSYPPGFTQVVESAFRARNPGLADFLDRVDLDENEDQEELFDADDLNTTPLSKLREEAPDFHLWLVNNIRKDREVSEEQMRLATLNIREMFKAAEVEREAGQPELPFGDVVEVPLENIATGAAVTFKPHTLRDPKTGRFIKAAEVNVYGDVRIDTEAAPKPVRREADIPTPESLNPIKERFDAEGFELYLVGGAVRDTLMGREIKDYDLASNATPDEIEAMLADVDGARLDLTGKDFAVVRVNMPDSEEYEIATFRRDVGEGRRPDEVEFTTIDEDVRRRDLTMNALFYDLSTNEIVDYVGGIDDIENGVVRAVGDPGERFREDPLRILRAFRFSGRTGWGMDSATVDAIRANSALRGVSGERVHDEFVRGIDSAVSPTGYIQQIDLVDNGTGSVWGQVFPGLNVSPERLPADGSYGNRSVLVASLLADNDIDSVKAVLKDRKFTNDEIADVELIMQASSINDGNVATLKNKFGKNDRVSADDMRAFHSVQPETEDEIEPFLQFADAPPALTANDLQEQGIKPGPQFGAMLREAEEQRYREIRDGFSVGGDKPGPRKPASPGQPSRSSELLSSFNDSDAILDEISEEYPSLSSDAERAADSLSNRKGEHSGLVYRSPEQMKVLRDNAQLQLDANLEWAEENGIDISDPDSRLGHYLAAMQEHIDLLDERYAGENAEYLDGYFEPVTTSYDVTDTNISEGIAAVIDSEEFQQEVSEILDLINPELRSTSRIVIAPTGLSGESINSYGGAYMPGEHAVYLHPSLFADVFKEKGISFDEFRKWANSDGNMPLMEVRNLKEFFDGEIKNPDTGYDAAISLAGLRERLLIHENAHGLHYLLAGSFDVEDDEEWRELRERLFKDLKESGFLDRISPDGVSDWYDTENYFEYIMHWMDHTGQRDELFNIGDGADSQAGMELFAEAVAWITEGKKFPGSDAIVDYINKKLEVSLNEGDRAAIADQDSEG